MNTFQIYIICNKKGKVLFVIQNKFKVSVCSPLASINTNCTLLALSSLTNVKVTERRTDTKLKPAMEADANQVRKTYIKTLNAMNFHLNIHLDILKKMERYLKDI